MEVLYFPGFQVFDHQHRHNTTYRNYCEAIGCSPETLQHWQDIPALPTDAFKSEEFPVVSFPQNTNQHTFLTSGTTTEKKGAHHFPTLTLYEASIRNTWQKLAIPKASCAVFFTPAPDIAPHSSLSHMMGVLEPMIAEDSIWLNPSGGEPHSESLKKLADKGKPLILLGTALSFLSFFDQLDEPVILPAGSRAMETGGYKGTRRQLEKKDLYARHT